MSTSGHGPESDPAPVSLEHLEQMPTLEDLRESYAWLDVDAIDDYRKNEKELRIEEGGRALASVEPDKASTDGVLLRNRAQGDFDRHAYTRAVEYVTKQMGGPDGNEAVFDKAVALVTLNSFSNMSEEDWQLGPRGRKKRDGSYSYPHQDQAGKELYKAEFEAFCRERLDQMTPLELNSPEAQAALDGLDKARKKYAKSVAERSKRNLSRKYSKDAVEDAGWDYEAAKEEVLRHIKEELDTRELTGKEKTWLASIAAFSEIKTLTTDIYEAKMTSGSKRTQKFLNAWAQWGGHGGLLSKAGLAGTAKKSATMMTISAVAGAVVSPLLPAAGMVAGGAAGLGAALYVGQRLFGARINNSADAMTVGEAQAEAQRQALGVRLVEQGPLPKGETIAYINEHTEGVVHRNRIRSAASLAGGLAVGQYAPDVMDEVLDRFGLGEGRIVRTNYQTVEMLPTATPSPEPLVDGLTAEPAPTYRPSVRQGQPYTGAPTGSGPGLVDGGAGSAPEPELDPNPKVPDESPKTTTDGLPPVVPAPEISPTPDR